MCKEAPEGRLWGIIVLEVLGAVALVSQDSRQLAHCSKLEAEHLHVDGRGFGRLLGRSLRRSHPRRRTACRGREADGLPGEHKPRRARKAPCQSEREEPQDEALWAHGLHPAEVRHSDPPLHSLAPPLSLPPRCLERKRDGRGKGMGEERERERRRSRRRRARERTQPNNLVAASPSLLFPPLLSSCVSPLEGPVYATADLVKIQTFISEEQGLAFRKSRVQ
eukprot:scaffold200562_cov34-Tisochrysis_lutea.AAC.1